MTYTFMIRSRYASQGVGKPAPSSPPASPEGIGKPAPSSPPASPEPQKPHTPHGLRVITFGFTTEAIGEINLRKFGEDDQVGLGMDGGEKGSIGGRDLGVDWDNLQSLSK